MSIVQFTDTSAHNVAHPTSHQSISRSEAIIHIYYALSELQSIINQVIQLCGLSVNDTNPITDVDKVSYETTMRRLQEW